MNEPVTRNINDYVNYYDKYQFSTVEEIVLAEDIVFEDFNDYHDAKFFYRAITPQVDPEEDEPETKEENGIMISNFVLLDIPSNILWSMIKPRIRCIWVDPETMAMSMPPEDFEEREELKAELELPPDEYNMVVLPGELHTCRYKVLKETVFLVEMIGGNMRVENGRIVGIATLQKDGCGIAEETEDEPTGFSGEDEEPEVISTTPKKKSYTKSTNKLA